MEKPKSLLIINNNNDFLLKVKNKLTERGYLACTENNLQSAYETAQSIKTDAIIIHIDSIKNNKFDFIEQLKKLKQYKNTPIVISADQKDNLAKELSNKYNISRFISPEISVDDFLTYFPSLNDNKTTTENFKPKTTIDQKSENNPEEKTIDINENSDVGLLRFKYTIDKSNASIMITDKSGKIQYINSKYSDLTGYSKNELIGKNPRILNAKKLDKNVYSNLWNTILNNNTWTGEFLNKKKNGEEFWEKCTITPVTNSKNIITHFIAVKDDITELKQTKEHINELVQKNKEVNQNLDKNNILLESIFKNKVESFALLDDEYNISKVSNLFANIIGKSIVELKNENFFKYFPSELKNELANALINNESISIKSIAFVTNNNEQFYLDINVNPIVNDNKKYLFISLKNNSELIEKILELEKESLKYKSDNSFYINMLNSLSDIAFTIDQNLNISYCNTSCVDFISEKIEQIITKNILEIEKFSFIEIEKLKDVFNKNEDIIYQIKSVIKEEKLFFEVHLNKINKGALVVLKKIISNNTQNYLDEKLFENMQEGFALYKMIYNDLEQATDYKFIFVNSAFEKINNISKEEIIEKTVKSVYPDYDDEIIEKYAIVAQTGNGFKHEHYVNQADKYYNIIVYSPKKDYVATIYYDITENKKIENEIIKSNDHSKKEEHRYKAILETAFDGFWILDKNGKIIDVNNRACSMLGYTKDEILKLTVPDIDVFDGNLDFHEKVIETQKTGNLKFETKHLKKDGSKIDVEVSTSYFPSENSNFLVFIQDITERNKSKKEAIEARNIAIEKDKLKAEFITNLSHEIRTPITGILGFADLLENRNLTPEKRSNYLKVIKNSGEQLIKIIDDILEVSKLNTDQIDLYETEVCLNDLVLEQFSLFDLTAKQNKTPIYIKKGLSDLESTILTDEEKLSRIISILIDNAIKYTNDGQIEFGYFLNDNNIEIYVKDTGIGIKDDNKSKIFDKYRAVSNTRKNRGLGLGLSIANDYSKFIGGTLKVESEQNKGTTFTLSMPYKPALVDSEQLNEYNKKRKSKNTKLILVAEDEEINYLYIETLLESIFDLNCEIIHAIDGIEAVKYGTSMNVDLILMDIKMPSMDGLTATKKIKEKKPNLPIIAQTAYTEKEDIIKAMNAGCSDYITKPIKKDALKQAISKFI